MMGMTKCPFYGTGITGSSVKESETMFLKSLVILTSLIQAFSWSDVKDAVGRFLVEPVCEENNEHGTTEGVRLQPMW